MLLRELWYLAKDLLQILSFMKLVQDGFHKLYHADLGHVESLSVCVTKNLMLQRIKKYIFIFLH